ncbi:hypothetical protein [Helicobacter mehlei]|nr:hypothetical protein [Helicobacter mehlei]
MQQVQQQANIYASGFGAKQEKLIDIGATKKSILGFGSFWAVNA